MDDEGGGAFGQLLLKENGGGERRMNCAQCGETVDHLNDDEGDMICDYCYAHRRLEDYE
jgi:formylmethanofuran dehydrogenase subunit E